MSDYTPTTETVLAYIRGNAVMAGATASEAQDAAVSWLAEVERAAAEKAWDEGYTRGNAHNGRRDDCPYGVEAYRQEVTE